MENTKETFAETFKIQGMDVKVSAGATDLVTTDNESLVWVKVGETRIVFPAEYLKQVVESLIGVTYSNASIKFNATVDQLTSKLKSRTDLIDRITEAVAQDCLHCKIIDPEEGEFYEQEGDDGVSDETFEQRIADEIEVDGAANELVMLGLAAVAGRMRENG